MDATTDVAGIPVIPGLGWPGRPRSYSVPRGKEFIVPEGQCADLLDAMRAAPRAYASYQDCATLGLNRAYGNEVTVRAVYGFPRDYLAHMVNWWTKDLGVYPASGIEFVRRPNLFLFDLEGAVIDTATYRDTLADVTRAHDLWGASTPPVPVADTVDWTRTAPRLSSWVRNLRKHLDDPPERQVQYLMWATEKAVDAMLPVVEEGDSGFMVHPDKPELWRAVLSSLGYVAVLDRHAVLTGDIGQQVAVLEPDAIRNTVMVANPLAEAPARGPGYR